MPKSVGTPSALTFILIILTVPVFFQSSCSTDSPPSKPKDEYFSEKNVPAVKDDIEGVNEDAVGIETAAGDEESVDAESIPGSSTDIFEKISRLWYAGYHDEARQLFPFDSLNKNDLWRLWRGRLFLQQWKGSDIGLAGENISSLLSDKDDIWAGTWTGGAVRFSEPLEDYTVWDPGVPSLALRTVNRIRKQGNTIWYLRYGSLTGYNKRSAEWFTERSLPVEDRLQDICFIGTDTYLATLGYGLWVKGERTWKKLDFPGLFINSLEQGRGDDLLIATMDRGMFIYHTKDNTWIRSPSKELNNMNITAMTQRGKYIAGGSYGKGGFLWDTEKSAVIFFDEEILGDPWVLAVLGDEGYFHYGTFGAGVNSLNIRTGEWDRISLAEGLFSADIASLAEDDEGNLWAGTLGSGIIKISGRLYGN